MENNKFNKFYSRKQVNELIEQLRDHRINGNRMEKEWFEALKLHLSQRQITKEESNTINYILSDYFDPLKEMESIKKQKTEFESEQKTQNYSHLGINPTKFISAGKNIKSVVYIVLVMNLFAVIAVLTAYISTNVDTIRSAYMLLGGVSLICNIIILFLLHSAGDNFEKSVYKKQE